MSLSSQEALEQLLNSLIIDKRTTFCKVGLEAGVLIGMATPDFEKPLYDFAAQHKLVLRVSYVTATTQKVAAARIPLRKAPDARAEWVSEALYGESVKVYDRKNGFAHIAREKDDYLGWVTQSALSHHLPEPSHWVCVSRGHIFQEPKVAAPILMELSLGAKVCVVRQENAWLQVKLAQGQMGFVKEKLLRPLSERRLVSARAILSLAMRYIDTPYVWGGVSAWGLDCSGLVQSVFGAYGISLPRDADQQSQKGQGVNSEDIEPADLVFFPGHVAIALSRSRIIHANAHHMRVTIDEKGKSAYAERLWQTITSVKRVL